jgi:hypothetical protein
MPMSQPELTPWRVATGVLATAVFLVALSAIASARTAILALAVFALAGAAARIFAPLRRAFVVRRRFVDVSVLLILGGALAYLGLTTPLG